MKCFLFVATIKAGNQPSVKNIFPLFFLRHFTLWMLDSQTREPNVKINLPAPKLLWRRMENIRRSFRAEWPEVVNNNNSNFHRKDSPQAWRVRERCVVRTERIKMGGGFVIISVLYCTVLYCAVLYCTWRGSQDTVKMRMTMVTSFTTRLLACSELDPARPAEPTGAWRGMCPVSGCLLSNVAEKWRSQQKNWH